MADDPLRELLTSPLDYSAKGRASRRSEKPRRPTSLPGGAWLVAGLVAGALAVLVGYLVGGDDTAVQTSVTTEPTTSTTTLAQTTTVALPPGYVPVDEGRLGIKVERVLMRPDGVFVTVSTVVPSGIDGENSSGFEGGAWELELTGGQILSSTTEAEDAASPGFVTIRFEAGDYGADDLVALRMVGNGLRMSDEVSTASAGTFTIPADGTEVMVPLAVESFALDAGITLALPEFAISAYFGHLTWRLEGSETDAVATVNPQLVVTDTTTGTDIPTFAQGDFGGFVFLSPGNTFFSDVPMTRGGEVGYSPASDGIETFQFPTEVAVSADFLIGVSWIAYLPVNVEIPLAETPVAVVE